MWKLKGSTHKSPKKRSNDKLKKIPPRPIVPKTLQDIERNCAYLLFCFRELRLTKDLSWPLVSLYLQVHSPLPQPIFKTSIQNVMKMQRYYDSEAQIPLILRTLCCKLNQLDACNQLGIFRISAPMTAIEKLQSYVEAGDYTFSDFDDYCRNQAISEPVHAYGGCLKLWLRELNPPLLEYTPKEVENLTYEAFIQKIKDSPSVVRRVLGFMLLFLQEFSKYQQNSRMSAENLVLVFTPCFCKLPDFSLEHMVLQNKFFCKLINSGPGPEWKEIFGEI